LNGGSRGVGRHWGGVIWSEKRSRSDSLFIIPSQAQIKGDLGGSGKRKGMIWERSRGSPFWNSSFAGEESVQSWIKANEERGESKGEVGREGGSKVGGTEFRPKAPYTLNNTSGERSQGGGRREEIPEDSGKERVWNSRVQYHLHRRTAKRWKGLGRAGGGGN